MSNLNKINKINRVEFPARDIEATKTFFETVLGWNFEDWEGKPVTGQIALPVFCHYARDGLTYADGCLPWRSTSSRETIDGFIQQVPSWMPDMIV